MGYGVDRGGWSYEVWINVAVGCWFSAGFGGYWEGDSVEELEIGMM